MHILDFKKTTKKWKKMQPPLLEHWMPQTKKLSEARASPWFKTKSENYKDIKWYVFKQMSRNELLKRGLDNKSQSINSKLTPWKSTQSGPSQIPQCFRKILKTGLKTTHCEGKQNVSGKKEETVMLLSLWEHRTIYCLHTSEIAVHHTESSSGRFGD